MGCGEWIGLLVALVVAFICHHVCPLQPVTLFEANVLYHAVSNPNCILGKWQKCCLNTLKNDGARWLFTVVFM